MDKEDPGSNPSVTARHTLTGKCPANSALEGGVKGHNIKGKYHTGKPRAVRGELHSALCVVRVGFRKHEPQN
jgi:hypothetical protein